MLYIIFMMFCFVQIIAIVMAAAAVVIVRNISSIIINVRSNKINSIKNNMYYYKNRGRRGIVRVLGGRSCTDACVALDTRAKRKLATAVVRKQAWLVKHSAWLVQKNKMYARTKRVRKQMRFAAMRTVQVVNARRKHVVQAYVYTNAVPKAARVDYLSIMRADKALRSACMLAATMLHVEDKALKGKATLNEQAQRAAMAAIWAGNVEARAVFSALRTEHMAIKARRTQIWDVLNEQVSNQEVAS